MHLLTKVIDFRANGRSKQSFFSNYLLLFCYIHIYNIFFISAFHSWSGFPLITLAFFSPYWKSWPLTNVPHIKKNKIGNYSSTLPEVFFSRFFIPMVSSQLTSYAFFITWITSWIALPILAPKSNLPLRLLADPMSISFRSRLSRLVFPGLISGGP